jgi:hypothetical protein
VYYAKNQEQIYRYETETGKISFVATAAEPKVESEAFYTTPNGEFLVFPAGPSGVTVAGSPEPEPRGAGHNELYRYDHSTESVMCVSCGDGVAPANGEMFVPNHGIEKGLLETNDDTPPLIQMSENGQEVFFQTTARLVPQDTNSTLTGSSSRGEDPGMDVYEWEADGAEEAPRVFCRVVNGCTHLVSSGEEVGPAVFLGASLDGKNLFFVTDAQLVPQATPEFTNIYDARVGGGFPQPAPVSECLSCQGVGSPPPLFSVPASVAFTGAGNPTPAVTAPAVTAAPKKTIKCPKGKRPSHGKCASLKTKAKHKAKRSKSSRKRR